MSRILGPLTPHQSMLITTLALHGPVKSKPSSKLDVKGEEVQWIRYSRTSNGHHIHWSNIQKVSIEWNVTFERQTLITPTIQDAVPIVGENRTNQPNARDNQNTAQNLLASPPEPNPSIHLKAIEIAEKLESPPVQLRRSEWLNPSLNTEPAPS